MKIEVYPIIFAALCAAVAFADWPQFQGPQRNGTSSESGLLRSFPEEGPRIIWEKDLEEGFGGCAVDGNDLFIVDRWLKSTANRADMPSRCFGFYPGPAF